MSFAKFSKPEPQKQEGNVYEGYRTPQGCLVYVDGGIVLPQTQTAKDYSPLGFEWGYGGSGPHALANAILAYELSEMLGKEGAEQLADDLDTWFKEAIIARLPRITSGPDDLPQWSLAGEQVRKWVVDYVNEHGGGKLENVHRAWHDVGLDDIWTR